MEKTQKKLVLMKNLPSCPKGRIFKEDTNGDFFHSMTDDEFLDKSLKEYKFTKQEVADNRKWFSSIFT